ncbi:MAG TPA: YbaY family lipoprotein [Blastocatellia bacterium]|nr:YbaY family lipoprotein [Blastocatellia bacterium]
MRNITGKIILPANAPAVKADQVVIEVRDVSLADAPSTVVAEHRLENVTLKPNGEIKFKITVPDVESNRTLAFRVHISLDGSGKVKPGDLLTTTHVAVPSAGKASGIEIPVKVI